MWKHLKECQPSFLPNFGHGLSFRKLQHMYVYAVVQWVRSTNTDRHVLV